MRFDTQNGARRTGGGRGSPGGGVLGCDHRQRDLAHHVIEVKRASIMGEHRRSFGALLKRFRLAAGLTHEGLAERSGLSVRAISDLERGISQRPRMETVGMLLDALRLSPTQRAIFSGAARPELSANPGVNPALTASGLPTAFTSFVGREREAATLRGLLIRPDARLVTVTGPGGVGKTRLAVEVAADLIDAFDD
ncbi:MAG TPA: helix-turn-helix domain-containing protein, partial [Thermomicrobiales bacterium]|nr:helix-turn-helix domain-containing protein [Thermomicrobiales bacterium]